MSEFQGEIQSGDKRRALVAIRDLLGESLEDMRSSLRKNKGLCRRCGGSMSEAGLAALAGRLKQTLDDIDALGDPERPLSVLDELRAKRDERSRVADPTDPPPADLGTKHAERRKGGRRPRGVGGTDS